MRMVARQPSACAKQITDHDALHADGIAITATQRGVACSAKIAGDADYSGAII
jgi:hypothetical protein